MIGSLVPGSKKIAIAGAGFSGLLFAYHLKKSGFDVKIYEEKDHSR